MDVYFDVDMEIKTGYYIHFFLNRFSSDSIKFTFIPLTDTSFYMYILFVLLMGIFHLKVDLIAL